MAGFIDGEGCITLSKLYRPNKTKTSVEFQPVVQIGMADTPQNKKVLKLLKEEYGGYYAEYARKKLVHRDTVFWRVTDNKATILLEDILPYLIIKREQAEIVIRFSKLKTDRKSQGRNKKPLSSEEKSERDHLVLSIRLLNQKGPIAVND